MREHKGKDRGNKGHNSFRRGPRRYRISDDNWKSGFRLVSGIYGNDRGSGTNQSSFLSAWYSYRTFIVFASTAAFGIGLSQLVEKLMGG